MKRGKFLILFLMFFILFSSIPIWAQTLTLNKMLVHLTKPQSTTLQKLNLIESYKGQIVSGKSKVKDVLKSTGSDGKAVIYLQKPFKGKEYEIVLIVSQESAQNIRKGKVLGFRGKFSGMSLETLRFEDVEIISKSKWWSL